MDFAKFSNDFLMETFTLVDNLFISEHLAYLDEMQVKIYLYGLYLCSAPDDHNSAETLSQVFGATEDELGAIYQEFEDLGLVKVLNTHPLQVKYLSLKRGLQPPKKYKTDKWNDFNTHLQSLYSGRLITPNEYNEYYGFLDSTKLDPEVLLMIVQYCIDTKGESVRYPYVFTVARSWIQDGVKTVDDVEIKLNEYEAQTEEMREILVAIGRKGGADLDEKQCLIKWKRSWGFEHNAILTAAKLLKGGKTFKRLDAKLDEYYRMDIFSAEQMNDYNAYREHLVDLAIQINKIIGVYYESVEHIIEVYTIPWTTKGFSDDALLKIAHHCFVSGVRTLEGLNDVIGKFYTQGRLTVESIDEFISAGIEQDSKIKKIIERAGSSRNVTARDREFYRTWSATWGFDDEVILYASELSSGKTYFVQCINRLLCDWKAQNVTSLEQAQKASATPSGNRAADYAERNYSNDELQSIFGDIENFDNIEV